MNSAAAPWVAETARRPIAFAQVREDALVDQWVVDRLPANTEVLMVASGGCTAAALATMQKVSRLHLVDPNPAQIALARLKLSLLVTATPTERLSILGHTPMDAGTRQTRLASELQALDLPEHALGPLDIIAREGPDNTGRYEVLFLKLRESLRGAEDKLVSLLELNDTAMQIRRADPSTELGHALDVAFDSVMSLPNLVGLFGEGATRNRHEPFSRHFARRTRQALATLPAAVNPYLWQMLRGHFLNGTAYPWLKLDAPTQMPKVEWTVASMADVLAKYSEAFDFIHLSNILDWLAPDEARATLDLTWKALRPAGMTLIRQLNSSSDIQSLDGRFAWDNESATALHKGDRSFFYRLLHLGQK
jgi:S-adenosylmethionine-diacylglycerol 3-amino-3-carboxypropyl transferase